MKAILLIIMAVYTDGTPVTRAVPMPSMEICQEQVQLLEERGKADQQFSGWYHLGCVEVTLKPKGLIEA